MYSIEFARKAAKFYMQADAVTAKRINKVLEKLEENPFGLSNMKQLKADLAGSYRIRIGSIRVIYSVKRQDRLYRSDRL